MAGQECRETTWVPEKCIAGRVSNKLSSTVAGLETNQTLASPQTEPESKNKVNKADVAILCRGKPE